MEMYPSAIAYFKSIIKEQPNYPFPYYFLAICLKNNGDDTWRKYANDGFKSLRKLRQSLVMILDTTMFLKG